MVSDLFYVGRSTIQLGSNSYSMSLMQELSMPSVNSEGSSLKTISGYLEEDIVECGEFNIVQETAFEFYETME
jgi:hypothetical protein